MMYLVLGLLLSCHAILRSELEDKCPVGFKEWEDVDANDWYWETDWEQQITNGQTIYPAGFRNYELGIYNEPPVCMFVPGSKNKKVEIMVESPMENVNLCIYDADYDGISNNNVGSVQNCGTGKLYACFTGAQVEENGTSNENFGFIVKCEEGCEDMTIDLWIRVRLSSRTWQQGKDTVENDLEHWCEGERGKEFVDNNGNTAADSNGNPMLYYTYPSDIVPDEPSQYPFHIEQIFGKNSGSQTKPHIWLVSIVALVGLACLFA